MGYMYMETFLHLGNVVFFFLCDTDLCINQELTPFLVKESRFPDINIRISWEWEKTYLPKTEMAGCDVLQEYYEENGKFYALSIGNGEEYLACAVYDCNCNHIECKINGNLCDSHGMTLGTVMRFLPIRAVFMHFGVLFFHASQISYKGKGILFTAPSGTGKTTQAELWKHYRNAQIICNDRTLIRKQNGYWSTYGYPLDGSSPVRSDQVLLLGCIVVLEQGCCNRVERLNGAKALSMLMPQLVMDGWNADVRTRTIELLLELLEDIHVYHYTCTKGQNAVDDLEQRLVLDGVFDYGENSRSPLV